MEKQKNYGLSEALKNTKVHPYGQGAEKLSAHELVRRGRVAGFSYKRIAEQLRELANINENQNSTGSRAFRAGEHLAHKRALERKEYKTR